MSLALMKEKNLVLPTYLISIIKKYHFTLDETLLFLYFWNNQEEALDVKKIEKVLRLTEEEILSSFNNLMSKKILNLKATKNDLGKTIDQIDLNPVFEQIDMEFQENNKNIEETEIYSTFEHEFARTISPMEYEIIHAWLEKGFSEELILGALKEAIYNGVTNLRYIDKILYEWQKKGYKTMKEVHEFKNNSKNTNVPDLTDWDWLEEHDE